MILEARIRKSEKGTVLANINSREVAVKQIPENESYSNFYHRLRNGEKIFLQSNSASEFILVTSFDNGMQDFFFQRMFGHRHPRREDMTYYQRRIVSALNRSREYQH